MALILSRPGQSAGTGDENALFLKTFAGEVLAAFQQRNKLLPTTRSQTITTGESAIFPAIGKATPQWHEAGESIITDAAKDGSNYLSNIKTVEKRIFVDDPHIAAYLISDIDRLKNHFDARAEYTRALGASLAEQVDQHILAAINAAANSAANHTGETGAGTQISTHTDATVADDLIKFAQDAATAMDDNDVPEEGRFLAVRPKAYHVLSAATSLVDRDLSPGNGNVAEAQVLRVSGMTIVKTNSFGVDDSAVDDFGSRNDLFVADKGYNRNWLTVGALAYHAGSVGTVRMKDISLEVSRETDRLAWLVVASYVMGHGVLRPESAVEMTVTSGNV